ncbi:MAG: cellulase family glycosylhydrolase [Chloroflexota bacterium]|nr:cellulase family glycosylhydrolase [Chloroflexota bacterium]
MMKRTIRSLALLVTLALVLAGLLALDLANRGLAWQALWSVTGEEEPLPQLRGVVEWLGAFTRTQPRTDALAPIQHVSDNPYGVNTFLQQEVEVAKRDRQVQMIADAGFGWIRQEFPWEDIEIHARGDFTDRRNDVTGDGVIDEISAWDKYDHIVEIVEQHGLRLQVRLSNPPVWTHSDPAIGEKAPPDDIQDFVNYAVAVATRYQGRIFHYQIWNEPNIYPEWGEQAVNPEAYTDMLCRTYVALKTVDPNIVVIAAALAPTINLTERNLSDLVFLQRMYDAGAGDCFDIMSTQGYGFYSGPTDQRMRPTTLTFSHHLYIRDIMVANGDAHKPIWLAEAAWNAQPEDPSVVTIQYGNFGIVTPEQAARYMPLAFERAQREWNWLGVINLWYFKPASDADRNQAYYYFKMVDPDFAPLPIYDAMRQHIAAEQPILYQGTHQEEARFLTFSADAVSIEDPDAQFGRGMQTTALTLTAHGTEVVLRWRGDEPLNVRVGDDPPLSIGASRANPDWQTGHLFLSLNAQTRTITFSSPRPFEVDAVTIIDRTGTNALIGLAVIGIAAAFIVWRWRRRVRV